MTRLRLRLIRLLAGKDLGVVLNARINGKGGEYMIYLHSDRATVCNSDFDLNRSGKALVELG
jgi:hypothetical protein